MNKEDFKKLLEQHDWFYSMSDDPRVWIRGHEEERKIVRLAQENPEFNEILKKEKDKIFPKF